MRRRDDGLAGYDPTLVAQILKISSSYSPPPPEGFVSPMTWGVEDNVIERFVAAGVPEDKILFERDTYTFNFPAAPSELVAVFRAYYGPTMTLSKLQQRTAAKRNCTLSWTPSSRPKTQARARISPLFLRPSCGYQSRCDAKSIRLRQAMRNVPEDLREDFSGVPFS
jgi:hypothetical protein